MKLKMKYKKKYSCYTIKLTINVMRFFNVVYNDIRNHYCSKQIFDRKKSLFNIRYLKD